MAMFKDKETKENIEKRVIEPEKKEMGIRRVKLKCGSLIALQTKSVTRKSGKDNTMK